MEFFELVKKRQAVRAYKPDAVSREDIMKILDAGNFAPSGQNMQQWEFIVVTGKAKELLGESYGKIGEVYAGKWEEPAKSEFIEYARTYGGAPVVIVVTVDSSKYPATQKMHLESGSAAMQNILLAARDLGLGTCWMTGPLNDEAGVRKALSIPDDREIVAVTPLGYPTEWPPMRDRVDPDLTQKVHWVE